MGMTDCDYMTGCVTIAKRLDLPAVMVEVKHDSWCPMVGGAGGKPCEPDFYVYGRKVKL